MIAKLALFTIVITVPILFYWFYINKKTTIDYRLLLSYFIFGSWFGMCGEIFIDTAINKLLKIPIPLWEYHITPIHNNATSMYGPIMWAIAAVCVCFFQHYNLYATKIKKLKGWKLFIAEAGFLMLAEIYFNIAGYFIFNDYFFYYFSPEFNHFSALVSIPFWWCGYKVIVKASDLFYKQEKLNFVIAFLMITIIIWGF